MDTKPSLRRVKFQDLKEGTEVLWVDHNLRTVHDNDLERRGVWIRITKDPTPDDWFIHYIFIVPSIGTPERMTRAHFATHLGHFYVRE